MSTHFHVIKQVLALFLSPGTKPHMWELAYGMLSLLLDVEWQSYRFYKKEKKRAWEFDLRPTVQPIAEENGLEEHTNSRLCYLISQHVSHHHLLRFGLKGVSRKNLKGAECQHPFAKQRTLTSLLWCLWKLKNLTLSNNTIYYVMHVKAIQFVSCHPVPV